MPGAPGTQRRLNRCCRCPCSGACHARSCYARHLLRPQGARQLLRAALDAQGDRRIEVPVPANTRQLARTQDAGRIILGARTQARGRAVRPVRGRHLPFRMLVASGECRSIGAAANLRRGSDIHSPQLVRFPGVGASFGSAPPSMCCRYASAISTRLGWSSVVLMFAMSSVDGPSAVQSR